MTDKRNIIIPEEPVTPGEPPKQEKPKVQVSDFFNDAIANGSSLVIECEFCGRIYFGDGGDYDEGERERLEEMAKVEPEKYIECSDFTRWGYLGGKQYAIDCECNAAAKYEAFIWNNRFLIATYLKTRSRDELEDAKREAKLFGNINVK
jgi:hypothetical protein